MNKATNLLAGFAAGAAAGVITGILVAPTKGSRTRRKIKNKMKDVTRGFAETISDQIEHLENQIKHLKKDAEKGTDRMKAAASRAEKEIRSTGPAAMM